MSGTDTRKNRKTSTILAMDVVGYSEKMSSDEEGTINQLRACRVIIEDSVKSYQGRIFNTAGDAFMVEFNSALSAVRAAIEIQEKVFTHNQNHDGHKGLEFRMGINMGDVVVDGENLLGDGVNVAARLEGIAPPGGICISEIVHSVVKGKVPCGFIDQGTQNLKNISEPVRAYYADTVTGSVDPKQFKHKKTINKKTRYYLVALAVVIAVGSYVFQGMQEEVQNGADFQRIAILPFDTGSQDQNLLNFANGLTEDLSAGFSKAAKKLTLVTLKEPPADPTILYRELNARYFIDGRIRQSGSNIRISVNLTDTKTMSPVWVERFDKEFTAANIFSLQDEIVSSVIDALVGNGAVLAQEVAKNFSVVGTQNLNAYECVNFVRGQYFKVLSPEMHAQGLECLRKAVKADPQYKEAWALLGHMLAWGYSLYVPFFQAVDKEGLSEAFSAADNAIRIDKNFARAYATRAELHFYERDWELMIINAKKAYELAPGDAYNVGHISYITVISGRGCNDTDELKKKFFIDKNACERLQLGYDWALQAHKLDAISSMTFDNYGLGHYYAETGQYEKMLQIYEEVPTPAFHWWNLYMGEANHNLGNLERARHFYEAARKSYLSITDKPLDKLAVGNRVWNQEISTETRYQHLKTYGWE